MPRRAWLAVLALSALSAPASLEAQHAPSEASAPRLEARRLGPSERLQIDGGLDEPAWAEAAAVSGFRQREPAEGESATEPTEVRVLYDAEFIYIGVRAFDSRPDRVVGRALERDASLGLSRFGPSGGDDAVEIIIDTFHDRRNAYYFATNPRGIEVDGLITDESESPDTNWDAVWEVRTRVDSQGWSAEFAIPLRVLRFPERPGGQVWGFNVQRVVIRKTEQSLWTSWSRDNEGLHRVSHAGELAGLDELTVRPSFYVKPYVLGEAGQDYLGSDGDVEPDGDLGVDAKLGLSSGQVVDLTVNTDFAQVEADDQQVDLTRFNLFFPEKREFFLENAGIFQFGSQSFGPPEILLFFSRRIGLQQTGFAEAQTVPIIAGGRFTGRAGGQTIGLLNVVTGEDRELGAPVTNFAVGRIKRDIGRRSYVGAIVTHRQEERGVSNLATGVDWNLWLSKPLVFEGFYALTSDSRPGGEDQSWRLVLDYTGDWFGWFLEHVEIGPDMRPEAGFIRRPDIASTNGSLRFTPRPPIPGLRRINIFNRFNYVVTPDERRLLDRGWQLRVSPQLDSGDELELSAGYQFQRLEGGFELDSGIVVPPGDYEDWTYSASLESSRSRPVSAELSASTGDFWDGDRWGIDAGVSFNSPHVGLEVSYIHNDVDVPAGAFTTDLVRGRLKLALNTRLFGNALVQYNSQNGAFSTNLRVDFIHRPGSDLFIVFNERRDIVDGRWNHESRAFIVKLTYLYWF